MILGPQAALPIAITFYNALRKYPVVIQGKTNYEGQLRLKYFPERKSDYAYPYKRHPLHVKVAGFACETMLHFCTFYLIFNIDLVGRSSLIKNSPFFLRLAAEIVQPIAQFYLSRYLAVHVRETFRDLFVHPSTWPRRR